jgi:hypothetical protein
MLYNQCLVSVKNDVKQSLTKLRVFQKVVDINADMMYNYVLG